MKNLVHKCNFCDQEFAAEKLLYGKYRVKINQSEVLYSARAMFINSFEVTRLPKICRFCNQKTIKKTIKIIDSNRDPVGDKTIIDIREKDPFWDERTKEEKKQLLTNLRNPFDPEKTSFNAVLAMPFLNKFATRDLREY